MIVISNVINMVLQLLYYSMNHVIFLNLYRFLLKLCWINKHCQCLNAIEISYLKFPLVINYVFYNRQTHTLQAMNWIVSLCTINSKIKIKSALVKSLDQVTVLTVARCTLSKLTKNIHERITFPVSLNLHKWPKCKVRAHFQITCNSYVKSELQIFLLYKICVKMNCASFLQ